MNKNKNKLNAMLYKISEASGFNYNHPDDTKDTLWNENPLQFICSFYDSDVFNRESMLMLANKTDMNNMSFRGETTLMSILKYLDGQDLPFTTDDIFAFAKKTDLSICDPDKSENALVLILKSPDRYGLTPKQIDYLINKMIVDIENNANIVWDNPDLHITNMSQMPEIIKSYWEHNIINKDIAKVLCTQSDSKPAKQKPKQKM